MKQIAGLIVLAMFIFALLTGCADDTVQYSSSSPADDASVQTPQASSNQQSDPAQASSSESDLVLEEDAAVSVAPPASIPPFDPEDVNPTNEIGREEIGLEEYLAFQAEIKAEYKVPDYFQWQLQISSVCQDLETTLDIEAYADLEAITIPYNGAGDYAGADCTIGYIIYVMDKAQVEPVVEQRLSQYDEALGPITIEWKEVQYNLKTLRAIRDDIFAQEFKQPLKFMDIQKGKLYISAYEESDDLEQYLEQKGYLPYVEFVKGNLPLQGAIT